MINNDNIKSKSGRKKTMFDKKIEYVNLVGDISYESAHGVINHLFQANKKADAIVLTMTTCGGDIYAGMSIVETMNFIQTPVFTYGLGFIGSMGVNIFLEGKQKFVSPNASFMIHESNVEYTGDFEKIQKTLEFEKYYDDYLNARIVKNTKFTDEGLKKLLSKKMDIYFTPDKLIENGFIESDYYMVKNQIELEKKITDYLGN